MLLTTSRIICFEKFINVCVDVNKQNLTIRNFKINLSNVVFKNNVINFEYKLFH